MDRMLSITGSPEADLTGRPRTASGGAEPTRVPQELLALLERQPATVHRLLTETLRRVDGHGVLDSELWGEPPDQTQVVQRSLVAMLDALALEREVAAEALSVSDVAHRAGADRAEIWARVGRRELFTIGGTDGPRIPEWQAEVPSDAIRALAEAYPGDIVSLTLWIDRPNDLLGGSTPRQVLARGAVDEVRMAAQAIAS